MKKTIIIFAFFLYGIGSSQELLSTVQINYNQLGGSNVQVFKTLEKSLRDFINNTSWTGKKLQNFEKIKCNFAIVINERPSQNIFKANLIVQSVRPVYNTTMETPMLNINDTNFQFEYNENENLIFNDRQFSGKNLIDVISFYVYYILATDADSYSNLGGKTNFDKALKIAENSQNQSYAGWSTVEGPRNRGSLIYNQVKETNNPLRVVNYSYHRMGLDNMSDDISNSKANIFVQLMSLKRFENNFQMNYPFQLFLDAKKNEIFQIFSENNPPSINQSEIKSMMSVFSPKDIDKLWSNWK